MVRKISIVAIALSALPLTGCWEFNLLSWSPDGRYLLFMDWGDRVVWRWDTVKQRSEKIKGLDGLTIDRAAYLSEGEALLFGNQMYPTEFHMADSPRPGGLMKLNLVDGYRHDVPPGANTMGFAISPDRKRILTIGAERHGEDQRVVVAIAPANDVNKRRILAEFPEDAQMPQFDRTGRRVLFMKSLPDDEVPEDVEYGAEIVLLEFDSDSASTKSIVKTLGEYPINPQWVGDDAFVYAIHGEEEEHDGTGLLMLYSFDRGEPEVLHERTVGYFPASVDSDGNTLIVSSVGEVPDRLVDTPGPLVQLLKIDLKSREKAWITDEPFGAYAGKFHPTRHQVAYVTGGEPLSVRILDLDTGKRQLVWRNDEERLFTSLERFIETGDTGLAMASYDELLHRYPESGFRSRAVYHRMIMHLESPVDEFDDAVSVLAELDDDELRSIVRPRLWEESSTEIPDAQEDLLRRYTTEASAAEFEFDTDRTRDLTGMVIRSTSEKLYLKIDFNSAYDLGGSVFSE